jgi:hypothetical protein
MNQPFSSEKSGRGHFVGLLILHPAQPKNRNIYKDESTNIAPNNHGLAETPFRSKQATAG